MSPILIIGSIVVTLSLISYSIGIFNEQRKRTLIWSVLILLGVGLLLDIGGTTCMIIGSSNGPFTIHGIIGFTALGGMLIDNILLWNTKSKFGIGVQISKPLHLYSRFAYIWWALVYFSGLIRSMHM
jgi:uncharacterized repeat protein (TIGR03987 family)